MSKAIYCLAFFVGFTDSLIGGQPLYIGTWGERGTGDGQFHAPKGLALDLNDNVYVVDISNDRIQKFDRDGNYLDQWGTSGSGGGQFDQPDAIALDSAGNIYVTEVDNLRVQKLDSAGGYLAQWADPARPMGIAIDSSDNVFVTYQDERVQKTTDTGSLLTEWGSGEGTGEGQFQGVKGVAVDSSGNVYVVDSNRIQKFTSTGTYLNQWGGEGSGDGQFRSQNGIAVSQNGIVYVGDSGNRRFQKFATDGTYLGQWGTEGTGTGQFSSSLNAVVVSQKGDVYAIDHLEVDRWFDVDALLPEQIADFESLRIYSDANLGDSLTLATNKNITVSTTTAVELGATLTLAGGSLTTGALDNAGQVELDSGSLTVTGPGGIIIGPSGQITTLSLSSGRTLVVTNVTTVVTGGVLAITDGNFSSDTLRVDGGTVSSPDLSGVSNLQVDAGTVSLSGNSNPVRVSGNNPGVLTIDGSLSLGDGTRFDGYDHQGTLAVGTHQVTLQSAGFANLGILTTLDGGELIAANGVTLGVGSNLHGTGIINAKVAQSAGSTIATTGSLILGDAISLAGFSADGELRINSYSVTLHDSNEAVLGSLTEIGTSESGGVLSAPNGLLLNHGKSLVGKGEVNTSSGEFRNRGFVQGEGTGITFNHLVTGEGTFAGTVAFDGGYNPGTAAALVELEDVDLGSANVLTVELGGLDRGTEYDAIDVSGLFNIDGIFDAQLIDGFVPRLGDVFEVIAFGGRTGDFTTYTGLDLGNGTALSPEYTVDSLLLTVIVPTEPEDLNMDGFIDGVDLGILLGNWGLSVPPIEGELDARPPIDGQDLGILLGAWNPSPLASTSFVPEPSALLLVVTAGMGLVFRRRLTPRAN